MWWRFDIALSIEGWAEFQKTDDNGNISEGSESNREINAGKPVFSKCKLIP